MQSSRDHYTSSSGVLLETPAFGDVSGSDTRGKGSNSYQSAHFVIMTPQSRHFISSYYVQLTGPRHQPSSCWRMTVPHDPQHSGLWSFPCVQRCVKYIKTRRPIFSGYLGAPGCMYFSKCVFLLNAGLSLSLLKGCRMHHFLKGNRNIYRKLVPVWKLNNVFLINFLAYNIRKISYIPNGH